MNLVERREHPNGVLELALARAPVNALDPSLCSQLAQAVLESVAGGVSGIVLSGGPKVFSAGLDVPHLLGLGDDRAAVRDAWGSFFDAVRAIGVSPVPVVAAIAGHAPAGGCVLALCCDYRVMARSEDAARPFRIGLNETQVGLVAPEGIQHLLRRVVGGYRAERMLIAGEMVDSARAFDIGLVDELVAINAVGSRALAWLNALLALPRQPMLRTREIARADLVAALQPERIQLEHFLDAWMEPDTQAGLRAMLARIGK